MVIWSYAGAHHARYIHAHACLPYPATPATCHQLDSSVHLSLVAGGWEWVEFRWSPFSDDSLHGIPYRELLLTPLPALFAAFYHTGRYDITTYGRRALRAVARLPTPPTARASFGYHCFIPLYVR